MRRIDFDKETIAALPRSREEALAHGMKNFRGDEQCSNGHLPVRRASDGVCFFCKREKTRSVAENRRRHKGQAKFTPLQRVVAGSKFGDLIATGKFKRERVVRKFRTYTIAYDEVTCTCGQTFWIRRERWGVQKSCLQCKQRRSSSATSKTIAPKIARPLGVSRTVAGLLWFAARKRAQINGIPFTIKPEDIHVPETCPALQIPLDRSMRRSRSRSPRKDAPSLDRVDNTKGYTVGNIRVISHRANNLKKDGTAMEHIAIAEFMELLGIYA